MYIDTYEFPVHMFIESSLFLIVKEEIIKKKQFSVSIRLLLTLKSYSLVILASILFWAAFRTFEIVYAYIHSLKAPYFSFSFFFSFFFLCIYHETIETIVLLLSYVFVYTYTKLFFNQGSGSRTLERIDHVHQHRAYWKIHWKRRPNRQNKWLQKHLQEIWFRLWLRIKCCIINFTLTKIYSRR